MVMVVLIKLNNCLNLHQCRSLMLAPQLQGWKCPGQTNRPSGSIHEETVEVRGGKAFEEALALTRSDVVGEGLG